MNTLHICLPSIYIHFTLLYFKLYLPPTVGLLIAQERGHDGHIFDWRVRSARASARPLDPFHPTKVPKVNKSFISTLSNNHHPNEASHHVTDNIKAHCSLETLSSTHNATVSPLSARKFSASTRRPFLDECLLGTHTLISGVHNMTGLPWAATIPLTAFLARALYHASTDRIRLQDYGEILETVPSAN